MVALMAVLMLASAGSAVCLFVYAGRRERTEDLLQRLHPGAEAATIAVSEARNLNPIVRWFCQLFWRAGSDVSPRAVTRALLAIAVLAGVLPMLFGGLAGLLVIAAATLLFTIVMTRRIARRRAKIIEQLPGYLESMMRVLAAGNTLEEAIDSAAREAADPLRSLFVSVGRQVRLGAAIDVVLTQAAEIHQIADLRVLALAARINRQYGGSLRNVFRSLIQAIRLREAASRELRALTAETRFSAVVLAAIPILVSGFIFIRNRGFYDDMLATSSGRSMLLIAVALQIIGVFIIWRMMRSTQDTAA